MNIKEAKDEIARSVEIYLDKNEFGEYNIPYMKQRPILPAVTITHPSGRRRLPNVLYCKNSSIAGASVSDRQLISSRNIWTKMNLENTISPI